MLSQRFQVTTPEPREERGIAHRPPVIGTNVSRVSAWQNYPLTPRDEDCAKKPLAIGRLTDPQVVATLTALETQAVDI